MQGPFGQAAVFVIDMLFSLYILAVLLRFLFQVVRADFYNPLSPALVIITNATVLPLRRIVPGLYGIDVASVVLLLLLECINNYLTGSGIGRPGLIHWHSCHLADPKPVLASESARRRC